MNINEGLKISGTIKIDTYRAGFVEAVLPLLQQLKACRTGTSFPPMEYVLAAEQIKNGVEAVKDSFFIRTAVETHNLVMDSANHGLDLLIQRLVGNNTYSGNLSWIEIGTGNTAPNVNDTALTTPVARAAVSFTEDFAATDAIVQAYIMDADLPNQTYYEVGAFVDGSITIGSGQLFNHALLSPTFTKVSGQDTTIQIDINIVNS